MNHISQFTNRVINADCLAALPRLPDGSIDFVLTDPPYLVNYRDRSGRTDIAMFRDEGGGRSTLSVLRGDGNTYKLYPTVWDSGPCGCSNLSAVKLVAGDFTGDGKTDLAQLYDLGNATWEIRVWAAKGLVAGQPAFEAPTVWLKAVPGTSDWNHVKIVTGDVDGDGKADIAEFYDYQGGQTKLWMHYSQRVAPSGAFAFTDFVESQFLSIDEAEPLKEELRSFVAAGWSQSSWPSQPLCGSTDESLCMNGSQMPGMGGAGRQRLAPRARRRHSS